MSFLSGCRIAALFLTIQLVHSHSFSQATLRFSHLDVRHGLSQSSVTCILQDSQGFMWLGTQEGLNRFDGYTFAVFKHNPADEKSLNGNFIVSIYEDKDGILLFETLTNADVLNRFDKFTETFAQVKKDSIDLKNAKVSSVFSWYEDHAGVRWQRTPGGGLTRLDTKTGVKTEYKNDPGNPRSLSDNRVYSVYGDRSGTIWIGTRGALERYDPATDSFIHYKKEVGNPNSLSDNWVWPIFEDQQGTLWVGTVNSGLHRFDRETGVFINYEHDDTDPRSLSSNWIFSIYQDRSGLLWVGTSGGGVNTFHPGLTSFTHYAKDSRNPNSLNDNQVRTIHVDRSGMVWLGTPAGLNRLDKAKKSFTHYKSDPANPKSLGDVPNVMYEDRSGVLWIGTMSNGLDRFDRQTGTFKHYRRDPANSKSLSDNRIYALLEDRKGTFWVGTNGGGLNKFDRASETFKAYNHDSDVPTSLSARSVWAIHEDHEGVLWVGTAGGGLNRFNPETETFTVFKNDKSNPSSLSDDVVVCIYEDRLHNLWVGTTGGLNRLDRATGNFTIYRETEGLPNNSIFGILEDGKGHLWLSTNKGLSRFDPVNETFRNYDASDGLQGEDFNQNAYAKNHTTGEMYFGGNGGFNVFHPDRVQDNPFVPPVVFSTFRRYNTDDSEGKAIEERGIPVRDKIELTYKDNIATFEFAALSYYNAFKNRYTYKLEGFSDNWIQLGTEHRATFTNLDPGRYTLRVKGSNNDGVWNEQGTTMTVIVTPPWWKTAWAYTGYVLMFFGALYQLRKFEINRREQKALVRESELRAKAAEAEKRALEAENERKTKELEEARQLQLSMLPREVPKLPQLEIAVFMKTATEVGGDYYDFHLAEDGTLSIACGDATGHGMQAGTVVTLTKGLFTSDASRLDIKAFLNHCSKAIKDIKLGRLLMALTLVKINNHKITFATAGMPPVFICRNGSGTVEEVLLKGMPLGAMKNFPYIIHEEELQTGDSLLLLTDGLPEQKNVAGEMFDYARVHEVLKEAAGGTPQEVINRLAFSGDEWMKGAVQEDDITMIAVKMKD